MSKTCMIGEETRIPLKVVWSVGGAIVGLVAWLVTMHVDVRYLKQDVQEIKSEVHEIRNSQMHSPTKTVLAKSGDDAF